jgi:two-component system, OmpR family, response regulator
MTSAGTLPATLALVDDDPEFSEYLAQFLCTKGVAAQWFADSDDLLCSDKPFAFDFYIVDLMLPGIDGQSLLRLLRKRTQVGILVVSGMQANDLFAEVIGGGADMHLVKPVSFEQVLLAVASIYRRAAASQAPTATTGSGSTAGAWRLDPLQRRLLAPDGAQIDLSATDLAVLTCLLEAAGDTVSRETLSSRLGLGPDDDPNLLNASIYRLRRRIERATDSHAPLQAKSRAGYVFRAPLLRV